MINGCKKIYQQYCVLNEHKKNQAKFKCNECGKEFKLKRYLSQHIRGVHCGYYSSKMLKCTFDNCSYHAMHRNKQNYHIKIQHAKEDLIACKWPGCSKRFSVYYIKMHEETHKKTKKSFGVSMRVVVRYLIEIFIWIITK